MKADTKLGHEPVVPPIVVTDVPRLSAALVERFEGCAATDVADLVGPLYTMDPGLRLLTGGTLPACGTALTVRAWPGDNLAIHGAFGLVRQGDVLVIDSRGHRESCGSGGRSLRAPVRAGLKAVVTDGAWRDVAEVEALGLPLFGRGIAPVSPPKVRPGEINVPAACGGVVVQPGDLIVADAECVAVVPRAFVARVATALEEASHHDEGDPGQKSSARRDYFRERFSAAGGIERRWSDPSERETP